MVDTIEEDRVKLNADGIVNLYQIQLLDGLGIVYLTENNDLTWQGHDYQGIAMQLAGLQTSSDDELARPKLSVANYNSLFSSYVRTGVLEGATVRLFRVLRQHVENNVNAYQLSVWELSRVLGINTTMIQFELRRPYDSPRSMTPARMYIPPTFPLVRLQ